MAKVLVLYYSMVGHIETWRKWTQKTRSIEGAGVTINRVPDLESKDVVKKQLA